MKLPGVALEIYIGGGNGEPWGEFKEGGFLEGEVAD